ncbi:YycH family regulatory protein [Halalkalibacter akibai]|uniref:YycH protein n=1 Tax=Halalkalibacter akibai (strain ATCC 43226 / DSM 21942 / CIP 109018 / JCM 9157 / 1139) TaxID=1236973 RepID=W4QT12_HALA3|nr:two-component system activity regulator YycH [Halalkalibacter akibai]GAE34439.1 YycH protein [Halalkalibacter akibai JCM 9157]
MNYEHIKSTVLIVLIGLSIVLTWQLYTFQPEIALLDDTKRYVPSESLNTEREEKKLKEVILPEQMIVHFENKFAMIPKHDKRFQQVYDKLLRSNLDVVNTLATGPFPKRLEQGGVEIIFPAAIPTDLFFSLFELGEEEMTVPLTELDRLFLFVDQSEEVYMQILSVEEERVIELSTDLSITDFTTYVEAINDFKQVEPIVELPPAYSPKLTTSVYVPVEPVKASRLSFQTNSLSIKYYQQTLFTDPSLVKYYQQTDGEDSYTDGNRIITLQNNSLFMEYINPIFIETQERNSKHIILNGYEFINGHGGWSDDYVLADWRQTELRDEASFMLHVNGYPVINFEGQGSMSLDISRSGNQIVSYTRPLFELDSTPIDVNERIELPSGQEVIERLNEQEFFQPERLSKVVIGYEMVMRNTSFVTIEPHWFVLYGNRWQKVTFEGGGSNGLE